MQEGSLLSDDGEITGGYSDHELLHYNRENIRSNPMRIKEWDWYQISDSTGRYIIQFTYGHASYIGQIGATMFDTKERRYLFRKSHLIPMVMDRMKMPATGEGDSHIFWQNAMRTILVDFKTEDHCRELTFTFDGFQAHFTLFPLQSGEIVIGIPFDEDPKAFYYNEKYNCYQADGVVTFTDPETHQRVTISFGPRPGDLKGYGLLDWGRGVWPWSTEWYWSNGTGMAEGKIFGFNLGCGFGNTQAATENVLFYEGKTHKLGKVTISHDSKDYMKPWSLVEENGRCNLTMSPQYDRMTRDRFLWVNNHCHQVFGLFNGSVILDDGRELVIDNLPAFAEHAVNHW